MKLNLAQTENRPFYQANIWHKHGGDPLLLDEYSTKAEAVIAAKSYCYKHGLNNNDVDIYVSHFDAEGFSDYSINIQLGTKIIYK